MTRRQMVNGIVIVLMVALMLVMSTITSGLINKSQVITVKGEITQVDSNSSTQYLNQQFYEIYDYFISINETNGNYYAKASDGNISFESMDASYVINQCLLQLSWEKDQGNITGGGSIIFSDGIYKLYNTIVIPSSGGYTLECKTAPWTNAQGLNEFLSGAVFKYYGNSWMLNVSTTVYSKGLPVDIASYPAPQIILRNCIFEVVNDSQVIEGGLNLNYANGLIENVFVIGPKNNYVGSTNPSYGNLLSQFKRSGTIGILDTVKNREQIIFNTVYSSNFCTGFLTCSDWITLNQCTAANADYGFVFYGSDIVTARGCHDYGCKYGFIGDWTSNTTSILLISPACENGGISAIGFCDLSSTTVIINPIFMAWSGTEFKNFKGQTITNSSYTS